MQSALKDTSNGCAILETGLTMAGKPIWGDSSNYLAIYLVLMAIYGSANPAPT